MESYLPCRDTDANDIEVHLTKSNEFLLDFIGASDGSIWLIELKGHG